MVNPVGCGYGWCIFAIAYTNGILKFYMATMYQQFWKIIGTDSQTLVAKSLLRLHLW